MLLVPYAVTKTEWPGPIATQYKISLEQLLSYNPKNRDPDSCPGRNSYRSPVDNSVRPGDLRPAISRPVRKRTKQRRGNESGQRWRGSPCEAGLCVEVTRRTTYA